MRESTLRWFRYLLVAWVCLWASTAQSREPLRVAVASNFAATAELVAKEFTAETDQDIELIISSTGKLYAQILRGAPFDIFMSADLKRPAMLQDAGLSDEPVIYAEGVLALWSKAPRVAGKGCSEEELLNSAGRVVIANPEVAPYGEAAEAVLSDPRLASLVDGKLVRSESVGQAYSLVAMDAVDVGLVSFSQVIQFKGAEGHCVIPVDPARHAPIQQAAAMLSADKLAAKQFINFLQTPKMLELVINAGYGGGHAK